MSDHPALLRRTLPDTFSRTAVVVASGSRWSPPPGASGTLVLVVSGQVTLQDTTGAAATFGPGNLLPFTQGTTFTLHNRSRTPAAITTFTRTSKEH